MADRQDQIVRSLPAQPAQPTAGQHPGAIVRYGPGCYWDDGAGVVTRLDRQALQAYTPYSKTGSFTPSAVEFGTNPLYLANSSTPIVVTVPSNANLAQPTGAVLTIRRDGVGSVSVAADTGVTLRGDASALAKLYGTLSVIQTDVIDTWELIGPSPISEATVDFGSVPIGSKTFGINDARAVIGTRVFAAASLSPAGANAVDELEMDMLVCAGYIATNGTITLTVAALPGPVTGQRKINYFLG